jgi:MFS transporter, NNP family, nitrate/nitrite transporter
VAAEHIGFSVWSIWSVMVLFMPEAVYGFSAGDKFLLGATATLVGACLRIPYTLATATFGGRNWTVFSAFVLLIPTVGTMWLCWHTPACRCGLIWCARRWPASAVAISRRR